MGMATQIQRVIYRCRFQGYGEGDKCSERVLFGEALNGTRLGGSGELRQRVRPVARNETSPTSMPRLRASSTRRDARASPEALR
jgi:hypothetical protein